MHSGALVTARDLAEEAVRRYREDGFVHVRQVLGEPEIAEFHEDAMELLEREQRTGWGAGDRTVLEFVADSQLKSEAMRRLAVHPVITGIAERLAGVPLRLFKQELLLKEAGRSLPTDAHFDEFALPFTAAPSGLTAWVALVDVPMERGCMTFVPGSHLLPPSQRPQDAWEPFGRPEVRWLPRVAVPVRAGDCTFHHIRTVHSAGVNATGVPRVSASTVYMDDGAIYRKTGNRGLDELPEAGELTPGRRLDGARFPRVG
ncbi:phytanoyl-CoA dioxygenase family protein [Actinomadura sp. KC345]|uniref:phytanoyl-CoA dioxygenase family protein n=1 Tax=Actinomadura sp. KC345 TaxID=2530371 RepID=UPI00104F4D05|nr:phytanoyl-CoA dioxygenase family protein [Actinomadura sp. KC345]TDC44516.1 phytanoyl-CoA dioxygenase family protein [Actinomadura sp. KC345]